MPSLGSTRTCAKQLASRRGLKNSLETELARKIDHPLNAIFKSNLQAIIAQRRCGNDVFQHVYSKGAMGLSSASAL